MRRIHGLIWCELVAEIPGCQIQYTLGLKGCCVVGAFIALDTPDFLTSPLVERGE